MPLRGGAGPAEEIGVVVAGQSTEVRFFVRNAERGFTFAPSGALPNFSSHSSCEDGDADHTAGYRSLLRMAAPRRLFRLRLDSRCGGDLSGARCEVWQVESGQLERRGACALPARLEEAELKKAGWR
jgi:hypothetical protein